MFTLEVRVWALIVLAAAVFITEVKCTLFGIDFHSIVPPLWDVRSAAAERIPELELELYEALLVLDNGYCQAFLLRLY